LNAPAAGFADCRPAFIDWEARRLGLIMTILATLSPYPENGTSVVAP
jgi:hypothetical protein